MIALPCISFGDDVRQPSRLETRNTRDVLFGIRDGSWRDSVVRVRKLPADSSEQRQAKLALPYTTWAGVFSRRSNDGLVHHSGQVGIDLDGLGEAGAVLVIQSAVADRFCLAAFRSVSGEGVRLIFRIPPCSPANHVVAFEQVFSHVRAHYRHAADPSGKDIARASYVSFDRGLWFNQSAETLPIVLPVPTQRVSPLNRCVGFSPLYAGQLAEVWPEWYGRNSVNLAKGPDGRAKTHRSLLELGKSLALHGERIQSPLTDRHLAAATTAWLSEHAKLGVSLRGSPDEYKAELAASARGATRKPWFKAAADKWLRWTRHQNFPKAPGERLRFAIRQHCAEARCNEFFIGARDAGRVAGVHFTTASMLLQKLIADGHLEKVGERRQLRDAQTFRLKT